MGLWSKRNINTYPDFWQHYLRLFEKKTDTLSQNNHRFIAFDTETTGFDYDNDRILSIGAVAIKNNSINVVDQLELYLEQKVFNEATVAIHGIRKNIPYDKVSEREALQLFIAYIGNATLIAHHAAFDRKMINKALERHGLGKLQNKILDTVILYKNSRHELYSNDSRESYTLDALCTALKISKSDRHTASGDAFITAMVFLKILSRFKKSKGFEVNDLLRM